MKEIRPCPFCGNIGVIERISLKRGNYYLVFVKCTGCHAEGHKIREGELDHYEDKAIDAWNGRK